MSSPVKTLLSAVKGDKSPHSNIKYRNPHYLETVAKQKFGDDIFVLGATFYELIGFWNLVQRNALSISLPEEVGRTVVDIDSKCHDNTSQGCQEPDEFKLTSTTKAKATKTSSTSYQLKLTAGTENQIGGNLHFKVGGPAFFNCASGGLTAGGSRKVTGIQEETLGRSSNYTQSLSQTYTIEEGLKVPTSTKVRALIKTWAVTYEADTVVKLAIDAKATIPVRYRSKISRKYFGGIIVKEAKITAKELFKGEDNYNIVDDILTFTRNGKLSYLSEEVEIRKEETRSPSY